MPVSADDVIDVARALVDPAIRQALTRLDRHNRRIAEYHLGYRDQHGVPGEVDGGKMIRGTLALLSARVVVGDAQVAVPAAVGVELIHQYSLLHDDIIDHDEARRHRPAAWTIFGSPLTILAGDALAALAIEVILDGEQDQAPAGSAAAPAAAVGVAASLAIATRRMLAGQAADLVFETASFVALDDCLAMVADKTGALIECAASVGALAAGGPPGVVAGLATYGRHLGMAFQLVDDLLGLWGSVARTGKPVGSDIASRKMSLPVVAALAAGGSGASALAAIYAQRGPLSPADVTRALGAIEAAGGRRWAQAEADRETAQALRVLGEIPMDAVVRAELAALTSMLCQRDN